MNFANGKYNLERLPFAEHTVFLGKGNAKEPIYLYFSKALPLVPHEKLLQNKDYWKSAIVG